MPKINVELLYGAAKDLGEYYMDSEWDCIVEEAALKYKENPPTFREFFEFVKLYQYYNTVVCACAGDEEDIESQLRSNYNELAEELGW